MARDPLEALRQLTDRISKAAGPAPPDREPDTVSPSQPSPEPSTATNAGAPSALAWSELEAWMGPPDLQALVATHRGYDKITPEAWEEFDRKTKAHRERMIRGEPYTDIPIETRVTALREDTASDPAAIADAAAAAGMFLIPKDERTFEIVRGAKRGGKRTDQLLERALRDRHVDPAVEHELQRGRRHTQ